MFNRKIFFIYLIILLSTSIKIGFSMSKERNTVPNVSEIEHLIFLEVNRQRISCGITPLKDNSNLDTLAKQHSNDMAKRQFFSHINPDKQGPAQRAMKFGFDKKLISPNNYLVGVAENIGKLPTGKISNKKNIFVDNTSESIARNQVRMWMSSPPHRKNILNKFFDEAGTGTAFDGKYYISTQDFR